MIMKSNPGGEKRPVRDNICTKKIREKRDQGG
jgi:hypothetical protein